MMQEPSEKKSLAPNDADPEGVTAVLMRAARRAHQIARQTRAISVLVVLSWYPG